jgi:hypothetical protein
MTPIPAKVLTVAEQSNQYRVLVQIELEKYLGSFRNLRFGQRKPFHGTCQNGQLDLFYYQDPGLKAGQSFPLWTEEHPQLTQLPLSREVDDLFNGYVLPWWKWCVQSNGAPFLDAGEESGTLRIGDQFWSKEIGPEDEACYSVQVDVPGEWQIPQLPPKLTLQIECKHSDGKREGDDNIVIRGAIGLSFSKTDTKRVTRVWLYVRIVCDDVTEWNSGMIGQYTHWLRSVLAHELTRCLQTMDGTPLPVPDRAHIEKYEAYLPNPREPEDLLDLFENFPGTSIRWTSYEP